MELGEKKSKFVRLSLVLRQMALGAVVSRILRVVRILVAMVACGSVLQVGPAYGQSWALGTYSGGRQNSWVLPGSATSRPIPGLSDHNQSLGEAFLEGTGIGVWNIGSSVIGGFAELGLMAYDLPCMAVDVCFDTRYRCRSSAGQGLENGGSTLEYYWNFIANGASAGVYGQIKAGVECYNGEISLEECGKQIGGAGVGQLFGARSAHRYAPSNSCMKVPIQKLPGQFWNNAVELGGNAASCIRGPMKGGAGLPSPYNPLGSDRIIIKDVYYNKLDESPSRLMYKCVPPKTPTETAFIERAVCNIPDPSTLPSGMCKDNGWYVFAGPPGNKAKACVGVKDLFGGMTGTNPNDWWLLGYREKKLDISTGLREMTQHYHFAYNPTTGQVILHYLK